MKKLHNIFASVAVGTALVFTLAGCSGKDVSLPVQLDMLPGESVALIDVAEYNGAEEIGAAETLKLLAEAQSQDSSMEFTFASDAPGVAVVDEQGVITAYSVGDANIIATCESLDFSSEIAVHVRGYATELDVEDTVRLEQDETYTLTTVVDGPVTVVYESAAPAIATVDEDGVITALRNGETTITATVPGSSLKDTCVVTIGTAVQSISLSSAAVTLAPGERVRLVAGTWPNIDKKVVWKTEDEAVATVADGMVSALAEGTTAITATVGGKTAVCTVTVADIATPETAEATPETAEADAETTMTESDSDNEPLPEDAEPLEEEASTEEETVESEKPLRHEKAPALEDYIQQAVDGYANLESGLAALQYMGPGPVVLPITPATPESATPETATPESATPESATPESATPESATPESATSETATPESATPESATPETASPETASPETATPETAIPENGENPLKEIADKTGDFFGGIADKIGSFFGF